MPLSVNKGAPAILSEPGSDFARAVNAMAKGMFPKEAARRTGLRLRPSFAKAG